MDAASCVYVEVPKAGCTSVKWALSPLRGGPPAEGEDIHRWFGYTHAGDAGEMQRWLRTRWADWFRFTVVRDPIRRFESFYYDKVPAPERAVYGSISRFVQEHFECSEWRWNPHAVPQAALLGDDLSAFDYVGRTEDMDELGRVLSERLGTSVEIGHRNRSDAVREPLTPAALVTLTDIYRADFDLLGYVSA